MRSRMAGPSILWSSALRRESASFPRPLNSEETPSRVACAIDEASTLALGRRGDELSLVVAGRGGLRVGFDRLQLISTHDEQVWVVRRKLERVGRVLGVDGVQGRR